MVIIIYMLYIHKNRYSIFLLKNIFITVHIFKLMQNNNLCLETITYND